MIKNRVILAVIAAFILTFTSVASAIEAEKTVIANIPQEISASLVGLRVYKNKAFIMAANGKYLEIDLSTGALENKSLGEVKVLDYDVVVGKIIYLNDRGVISGYAFPKWNKGPFNACRIEACDQGVVLFGGKDSFFLAKNQKEPSILADMSLILPIDNGFMWSLALNEKLLWEANLYDCFGNEMGKVYKFSDFFKPSNLEVGPNGIDGEMLVSATEGDERTLALIGNNGRMFWKINGPKKLCLRDVAFDHNDNLVFLEKSEKGDVILTKWSFTIPEG